MKKVKIKAEIESKIERLRAKFPDSVSRADLDGVEKELNELLDMRKFVEHPHFQKIVKKAADKVYDINTLLLLDKDMEGDTRLRLFIERDVWQWILKAFGVEGYDDQLAYLDKVLDDKLKS